jgi:tetratricopeptide (TPR) repeat protein
LSYLVSHGRDEEAIAFAQQAFVRTDKGERPRLLVDWAIALGDINKFHEALPLLHQAIALNPQHYYSGYHILTDTLISLGDEEGGWRAGKDMRRAAGGRPGRAAEVKYDDWDELTWNFLAERDAFNLGCEYVTLPRQISSANRMTQTINRSSPPSNAKAEFGVRSSLTVPRRKKKTYAYTLNSVSNTISSVRFE